MLPAKNEMAFTGAVLRCLPLNLEMGESVKGLFYSDNFSIPFVIIGNILRIFCTDMSEVRCRIVDCHNRLII